MQNQTEKFASKRLKERFIALFSMNLKNTNPLLFEKLTGLEVKTNFYKVLKYDDMKKSKSKSKALSYYATHISPFKKKDELDI